MGENSEFESTHFDMKKKRAGEQGEDAVLGQFLNFLARDMTKNPQQIQALDAGLVNRIQSLVGEDSVDFDTTLSIED